MSDEIRGNAAAAEYVNMGASTWRAYVSRQQAPQPDHREIKGGHAIPVWKRETLDRWIAARPGRGHRRAQ